MQGVEVTQERTNFIRAGNFGSGRPEAMEEILWRNKAFSVPREVCRGGADLGGAIVLKLTANVYTLSEGVKDAVSHPAELNPADTELDAGHGPQLKPAQRLGGFAGGASVFSSGLLSRKNSEKA
jgi:hypothetical protein